MPSQKKMCLLSGKYPIIQYTQLQMCHKYEDVIKVYGIKRDGFSFFNFREICFWPKWHIRQGLDLFSHLKQLNTKQNILIIFKTLALREKKDRDRKQTVWVLWLPRSQSIAWQLPKLREWSWELGGERTGDKRAMRPPEIFRCFLSSLQLGSNQHMHMRKLTQWEKHSKE